MKKLTALLLSICLVSLPVLAKPVKSMEQAIQLVKTSVIKNKLTAVKMACLDFRLDKKSLPTDFPHYYVNVYQKASEQCAENEKKLFGYIVNKKKGWLQTNAIAQKCYTNTTKSKPYPCDDVGKFYVPIDPEAPVIIYDPPR